MTQTANATSDEQRIRAELFGQTQIEVEAPADTAAPSSPDTQIRKQIFNQPHKGDYKPLGPQQRIEARAAQYTQIEIDAVREKIKQDVPFAKRFLWGMTLDSDDIARDMARRELYPGGTIGAPDEPTAVVGPAVATFLSQTGEVLFPPMKEAGFDDFRDVLDASPQTGTGARAGGIASEVFTTGTAMVIPHTAPVIFASKAARASEQTFEETGSVAAGVGTAAIEALTEMAGYKIMGKVASPSASQLGRLVMRRAWSDAAKVTTGMLVDAGVEVGEELMALIGEELNRAAFTDQTINQSVQRIKQQIVPTTADSAAVGVLLFIPSLMSPKARRQFRLSMETGDIRRGVEILQQEGISDDVIDDFVESVQDTSEVGDLSEIQEPSEPLPIDDLQTHVADTNTADLAHAVVELDQALQSDDQAENADKLDADARDGIEYVRDTIKLELSKRGDEQAEQSSGQTDESASTETDNINNDQTQFTNKSRETKSTKALLERIGIKSEQTKTITPGEALTASLKAQRVAANRADRAARQEERSKFRQQLRETRSRLIAEKREAVKRAKQAGRDKAREIRESARSEKLALRQRRSDLAKAIKTLMPQNLRGAMISQLSRAETPAQFARATLRIEDLLKKHETKIAREDLKTTLKGLDLRKIKQPLRDDARRIVNVIDPRRLSKSKRAELQSRLEHIENNPDARLPVDAVQELERLSKTAIDDMSKEQADHANNLLSSIIQENELFRKLKIAGKLRDREQIAIAIAKELESSLSERKIFEATDSINKEQKPNLLNTAFSTVDNLMPRSLARVIGGGEGSKLYQILYRNPFDAKSNHLRNYFEEVDALTQFMSQTNIAIDSVEVIKWSSSLSGEIGLIRGALTNRDVKSDVETHKLASGKNIKITPAERLHILTVLRDDETYDLVINRGKPMVIGRARRGANFKLTLEDLQALRESSTPQQLALVDFIIGRANGKLRQSYAEWSFNRYGVDRTRQGTHYTRQVRKETEPDVTYGDMKSGFHQSAVDSVGINQDRVPDIVNPVVISDIFQSFTDYVWQSTGLVAMDGALRNAKQVLASGEVGSVLNNRRRGRAVSQRWRNIYEAMEKEVLGGTSVKFGIERWFSRITRNVSKGILGLNLRIALYQPVSFGLASRVLNRRAMVQAVLEGAMVRTSIDERMYQASPYLRYRNSGSYAGLVNEGGMDKSQLVGIGPGSDRMLFLIGRMDRIAIRTIWRASEIHAQLEGLTGDEAARRTVELAERVVVETQPTFDPLHISGFALEARERRVVKIFTFFRSQTQKNLDMLLEDYLMVRQRGLAVGMARLMSTALLLLRNIIALEAIAGLYDSVVGGDPEKEFEQFKVNVGARFAGLPIFGGLFSFGYRKLFFPDRYSATPSNPLESAMVDTVEGLATINRVGYTAWDDPRYWDGMIELARGAGVLTGTPVQAILRDAKAIVERNEKTKKQKTAPSRR